MAQPLPNRLSLTLPSRNPPPQIAAHRVRPLRRRSSPCLNQGYSRGGSWISETPLEQPQLQVPGSRFPPARRNALQPASLAKPGWAPRHTHVPLNHVAPSTRHAAAPPSPALHPISMPASSGLDAPDSPRQTIAAPRHSRWFALRLPQLRKQQPSLELPA